jgi:hypothetical protein
MRRRWIATYALVALALLLPCLSLAQEIGIEERPRRQAPAHGTSAPPVPGAPGRDVRVDQAPGFIEPFVGTYETPTTTGQFGLSGWIAPNPPVGPPYREVNGWFSFGFSLTWDPKSPRTVTR